MSGFQTNASAVVARAIEASSRVWSPEAAKALLSIRLSPADVARMNELAAKAQAGTFSAGENIEIEAYRSASRMLEILKLHARLALNRYDSTTAASD